MVIFTPLKSATVQYISQNIWMIIDISMRNNNDNNISSYYSLCCYTIVTIINTDRVIENACHRLTKILVNIHDWFDNDNDNDN